MRPPRPYATSSPATGPLGGLLASIALLTSCAGPAADSFFVTVAIPQPAAGSVTSTPGGLDCPGVCEAAFAPGAEVVLQAAPAPSGVFVDWSGACAGSVPTCALDLVADASVTARFARAPIVVDDPSGGAGGAGCTLRDALSAANRDEAVGGCLPGDGADVIELMPGVTIELSDVDNDAAGPNALPAVTSEVTVLGRGATLTRAAGSPPFRFLTIADGGDLTLNGLTLSGGDAGDADGGAVLVAGGALRADDVVFAQNVVGAAHLGGAVMNDGGAVTLRSASFSGNSAPGEDGDEVGSGSAIANRGGELAIEGSELIGNGAFLSGERGVIAGLGHDAVTRAVDTLIEGNDALGVYNEGDLYLTDVTLALSASQLHGGLVNEGVAFLERVDIDRNNGELTSGVRNSGFLRLRSSSVTGHSTAIGQVGLWNAGVMEVIATNVSGNDGRDGLDAGGGVTNSGRLTLVDSRVVDNVSDVGGGVWNAGHLTMVGSLVDGNSAVVGGGIYTTGTVELLGGSVVGGQAGNAASESGGGVYLAGDGSPRLAVAEGSAVRGNTAAQDGGGVYAAAPFTLELCPGCEIAGNTATTGAGGGLFAPSLNLAEVYAPGIVDNAPDAVAPGGLLVVGVAASQDDAEERREAGGSPVRPRGTVSTTDSVLDLTSSADGDQYVGLRFTGVAVPQGAVVVDARLLFTAAAGSDPESVGALVGVEDAAAPGPYLAGDATFDLSGRALLGTTFWNIDVWQEAGDSGPAQATPTLRNQVQAMVDDPGWASGGAMAFVVQRSGTADPVATRAAVAFDDDPAAAPTLWLLYAVGP